MKYFKSASIGGTFHAFHKGHKNYIKIAFGVANFVIIYLTSDKLAQKRKSYQVCDYLKRKQKLLAYLNSNGWNDRFVIIQLNNQNQLNKDLLEKDIDIVIVEPAYFQDFSEINRKRRSLNKDKFCLLYKPRDIDKKGNDISSTLFESSKKITNPQS